MMTNRDPSGVYVDEDLLDMFMPDVSSQKGEQKAVYIPPAQVEIDPSLLDDYTGVYEFFDNALWIAAGADHLLIHFTWETVVFYPKSDKKFFRRDFDAQFLFLKDESGAVDRLVYHFRGTYRTCFS